MGLLEWLFRGAELKLEDQVFGSKGLARGRFRRLDDDAPLEVRARLQGGHTGQLRATARPQKDDQPGEELHWQGKDELVLHLGPGKPYRGTTLDVEADVSATGSRETSPLAVLSVELAQHPPEAPEAPPLSFDTFSVESRFDEHGRATLALVIELG